VIKPTKIAHSSGFMVLPGVSFYHISLPPEMDLRRQIKLSISLGINSEFFTAMTGSCPDIFGTGIIAA
jgi:hypothetical protein